MVNEDPGSKGWESAIIKAESTDDYLACADIWLQASLLAHDFIDGDFWRAGQAAMAAHYLPASTVTLALNRPGEIAAFSAVRGDKLEALFVRPGNWGQGWGGRLLENLFGDHQELTVSVYVENKRAVNFYLNRGFCIVGQGLCSYTGAEELTMTWTSKTDLVK